MNKLASINIQQHFRLAKVEVVHPKQQMKLVLVTVETGPFWGVGGGTGQ